MANLIINGKTFDVDVEPDTPLLWAIRENVGLTGTKYGCGIAQCGACTVHIDGVAMRSCSVPVSEANGKQITTIEGLAANGALHKVQQAWIAAPSSSAPPPSAPVSLSASTSPSARPWCAPPTVRPRSTPGW